METSILTTKGGLHIPKRLRKKYGIELGIKIMFEEAENGLIIKPLNKSYFESFAGILQSRGNFNKEMNQFKEEEKRLENRKLYVFRKSEK